MNKKKIHRSGLQQNLSQTIWTATQLEVFNTLSIRWDTVSVNLNLT